MSKQTKYFRTLLQRYEAATLSSGRKPKIYQKMKEYAKTFSDWTAIYQYGDDGIRYRAVEKMKETVLDDEKVSNIQTNILELFEIVTYWADRKEILEKYVDQHCMKDDLLFVLAVIDMQSVRNQYLTADDSQFESDVFSMARRYYKLPNTVNRGIDAKEKKLYVKMEKSKFINWLNRC